MEATLYSANGDKLSKFSIPEVVFGLPWNADLAHQVMESERSNQRVHRAKVKMRGEVSGGGKKPWRQKGTGRARHGSIRSPLWVGGGVAHGPNTEKVFAHKINSKVSKKALAVALSAKLKDNEIIFVDALPFDTHKTKQAKTLLCALAGIEGFAKLGKKGGTALLLTPGYIINAMRAARNIQYADVKEARMLQVCDILSHKFLIMPKETISVLEKLLVSRPKNQLKK